MNVFCPNCNTLYRVDPAKVPESGVRARCAVCSAVFAVRRDPSGRAGSAPPDTPAAASIASPALEVRGHEAPAPEPTPAPVPSLSP